MLVVAARGDSVRAGPKVEKADPLFAEGKVVQVALVSGNQESRFIILCSIAEQD